MIELILIVVLLCSVSLVKRIQLKKYESNLVHFFALLENASTKNPSLFTQGLKIQGHYQGRKVICKVAYSIFYGFSGTGEKRKVALQPLVLYTKFYPCPIYLAIETLDWESRSKVITTDFGGVCACKQITENTQVYSDGRIYYSDIGVSDEGRGFRFTGFPTLDPKQDKQSLWALVLLELSREEVKYFLDELTFAAERMERLDIV
ncbi:MAG: hypothetical protein H6754_08985 [Candidatus Omnitrophica bacterium]|nr:hypothetical protein [Candidatus Omnitrophota bacterium]